MLQFNASNTFIFFTHTKSYIYVMKRIIVWREERGGRDWKRLQYRHSLYLIAV